MAYSHPRPAIKCVNSPPPSLKCSFCELILYDPVISVKCGHTFCHICAEEMALKGIKCPQDEIRCSSKMVVSNRAVKMQLDDLQIHCPNGLLLKGAATNQLEVDPSGCQDVFKLSELQDHLKSCQFGLVDCPQGRQACGLVRKKDLEEHLQSCSHFFCMYRNRGKIGWVYPGWAESLYSVTVQSHVQVVLLLGRRAMCKHTKRVVAARTLKFHMVCRDWWKR